MVLIGFSCFCETFLDEVNGSDYEIKVQTHFTTSNYQTKIYFLSALKFVTPNQRHKGEERSILASRKALYEAARKQRPERWRGSIRNWEPTQVVFLNLKKSKQQAKKAA